MTQTDTTTKPKPPTQNVRRLAYGLNVFVAVALAVALLGLVNWLGNRHNTPLELPFTRHYKLSEQTRSVLGSINDNYTLITLFRPNAPTLQVQEATALTDLYARLSGRIDAEHITSGVESGREKALFESILRRYADQLDPIRAGIKECEQTLRTLQQTAKPTLEEITRAVEALPESDTRNRNDLTQIAQILARFGPQFDELITGLERMDREPLPDYSRILEGLRETIAQTDASFIVRSQQLITQVLSSAGTPPAAREGLTRALALLRHAHEKSVEAITKVRDIPAAPGYTQLRDQLSAPNTVLILGENKERVISLDAMFREVLDEAAPGTDERPNVQRAFLGEELLTGALVSLEMKQPPLIVFVGLSRHSPLVQTRGQEHTTYSVVAERLRKMNFDVKWWNPMGRPGPMGQPMPAEPAPVPAPGQTAVWVFLPVSEGDPMMAMAAAQGLPKINELFMERVSKGDSAMVILDYAPASRFSSNQLLQFIEAWGIKPQLDRIILRQVTLPNRQTQAVNALETRTWPDTLSVTRALRGLNAGFLQACPITLETSPEAGVTLYPLVEITDNQMWAQPGFSGDLARAKLDPETAAPSFIVAAAAQKGTERIAVFADPVWATDAITNYGPLGPGSAELFGASFPGNQELFLNTVFWLANLDQLIASSPRTQDIRRIQEIDAARLSLIRWSLILGLPLLTLIAGIGVYIVRRTG